MLVDPNTEKKAVKVITRTLRLGDGGEQGHEAGKAEKLGDKNGGVGLSLVALDTMKRLSQYAILSASLSKNSTSVATHPPANFNSSQSNFFSA